MAGVDDEWVLRERERLQRRQVDALERLVHASVRRGAWLDAIRDVQAIVELDGLYEDAHRQLMRLYLLTGQRAQALRQYDRCRALLRHDLSIVPTRATQELYRSIAADSIGYDARPHVDASAGREDDDPVVLADRIAAVRSHLAAAEAQLLRAISPAP